MSNSLTMPCTALRWTPMGTQLREHVPAQPSIPSAHDTSFDPHSFDPMRLLSTASLIEKTLQDVSLQEGFAFSILFICSIKW